MSTTTTTTSYAGVSPPVRRLPLGVAILAILVGIFGFLLLLAGLLGIFSIAFLGTSISVIGGGLLAAFIVLIFGLILLGVAVGLWNQRLWALALAILVLLILVALNLYRIFFAGGASLIVTVIEVLLLIYLIAVSGNFY